MSAQMSMEFGRVTPIRRVETPAARATDPHTSHIAAESFTDSGKRQSHLERIIDAVYAHPGCTAGELTRYTGLTHVQIDRRTGDMRVSGRIVFGPSRECRVVGSQMQTLWPVQELERAA